MARFMRSEGVTKEALNGSYGNSKAEGTDESEETSQNGLFDMGYDNIDHKDYKNFSGDLWYNYSCHKRELASNFLKDVMEPTICCIGAVGIVVTMVVLTRKHMCTSCNCYLTALAVGDLLFLLILLARSLTDRLGNCSFHFSGEYIIFGVYSIIFQDIFLYLTIGVTVMLAVERYIAVCHPMRTLGMCTIKRARMIIVVLFVVAFILRCPKFMDIQVKRVSTVTGENVLTVTWVFPYDETVYTYIVTVGILTIAPLLTLIILNIRIIQELRRSSRYLQCYLGVNSRARSVVSSEELKITFMLIGVVLAFFVCHVPYMVFSLIMAFKNYDTVKHDFLDSPELIYFQHVCHSFLALRSSCNFILYCWFSEKFWATFKHIFCVAAYNAKQASLRTTRNHNGNNSRFNSNTYLNRSSFVNTRDTMC